MRLKSVVAALVVLSVAVPASAQWVEFVSKEDRFTVTFPAEPTVAQITYKSQFAADLPARLYTVQQGQSRFTVTVVDYSKIEAILAEKAKSCPPGAETCRGGGSSTGPGYSWADRAGAVIYATWQFMQRPAKVTQFNWNNIDLVEGHMLTLDNADKSRTSAAIYMHEDRLYILEGTVPEGLPEPGFFQQSVGWIDENGNGIRYQTLYHNGFPKPPTGRGGQGGPGQAPGGRGAGPAGQPQ
jgi:hypothetical protein